MLFNIYNFFSCLKQLFVFFAQFGEGRFHCLKKMFHKTWRTTNLCQLSCHSKLSTRFHCSQGRSSTFRLPWSSQIPGCPYMNKQVLNLVVGPRLKKTMHKFRYVLLLFFCCCCCCCRFSLYCCFVNFCIPLLRHLSEAPNIYFRKYLFGRRFEI